MFQRVNPILLVRKHRNRPERCDLLRHLRLLQCLAIRSSSCWHLRAGYGDVTHPAQAALALT